ncbi:MaoC/PaaZ C-terminal domain-containing protein [Nocardioides sp.]|uniref:MaoC/PaaZ C-terminal domain-containing protein n=1 Tax=Nocardioides sp. TaxID=35761 RepID=UPI00321B5F83
MRTDIERAEIYADDVRPGDTCDLGTYHVTEAEIIDFASRWDPQFFHVDVERASTEGHYDGIIASGLHTLGIYQRLSVTGRVGHWRVIAGAGLHDVKFRRPVRPGDTLTGTTRVESVDVEEHRARGLVTYYGELTNQHAKRVFTIRMSAYLEARPA